MWALARHTRSDAVISPVRVCFMPKKDFVVTASCPRNFVSRVVLLEETCVEEVDRYVLSSCMCVIIRVFLVMEQVCGLA